jgi:hypothetical protein
MGSLTLGPKPTTSHLGVATSRTYQRDPPTCLYQNPITGSATLLHPRITPHTRYRNINLFSINYAFRPHLRGRLTLGGLTFPRKPWAFGEQVSHLFFATYASICSCSSSSIPHGTPSAVTTILLYHSFESIASVACLSPVKSSAQKHSTSELLRFL